jgi:prolipoprotein diacylglyceryltransferase
MWAPDVRGRWERRRPTQLLEAGWAAAVLLGVVVLGPAFRADGVVFVAVVAGYSAGRLAFRTMRA